MDILYQLPFPDDVCSKIFMFACKSPHSGFTEVILKNMIGLPIYNKLVEKSGIVLDGEGHVKEFQVWTKNGSKLLEDGEREQLTVDIANLESLPNLTTIDLFNTGVTGYIVHLESLHNLTEIWLDNSDVTGTIENLKSLPNLTEIGLSYTASRGTSSTSSRSKT